MYFLTVCLNPTLQKIILLDDLQENEVNRSNDYHLIASGKGINVSRVLTQLDQTAIHLTHAGGMFRDLFLHLANEENIIVEHVASESELRFCYTICSNSAHTSTELVEESKPVAAGTEERVRQKFRELRPDAHTIIISGSKAAGFSDTLFPDMVREAKLAGKKVICDFRGNDLRNVLPFEPDVIKPNFSEFRTTFLPDRSTAEQTDDPDTVTMVKEVMQHLHETYGTIPVVTRGNHDILFIENGSVATLPADRIVPVNTIGCGDAFTAGFAVEYHAEKPVSACVTKGRACATHNALQILPGIQNGR